jgi:uncharacterized membrane protein
MAILVLSALTLPFVAVVLAVVALKRLAQMDRRLRALETVRTTTRVPTPVPPITPGPEATPPIPAARPEEPGGALEQRIGARWATWVGVLSLIITVGLLLRWTFENNIIGPAGRVTLGLAVGIGLLLSGLVLRSRHRLPYLAEGLSGGGLAILYLSLYAANTLYGLLGTGATFALMSAVTVSGIAVAVASDRQSTAVLAVLGGLLTPVLVSSEHPDERVLIAYLFVLGALVLGVAIRKLWIALDRLSFTGSMLLLFALVDRTSTSPHPVTRLALLSALAALFAAVPLVQAWLTRRKVPTVDLWIVVGNAAAYFLLVYATLERWHPRMEGPWALALAAVYVAIARLHKRRVPDDDATVGVLLGNAVVLATLAFPLTFDGPSVTLAWATEGAVLVWLAARRVDSKTALSGGLVVLFLAVARVVALDRWWYPPGRPVWNVVYGVHLLVVAALAVAGTLAVRPPGETRGVPGKHDDLRTVLWFAAVGVLAMLFWRELPGLWPAGGLLLLLLLSAWLGRVQGDLAFLVATPMLALVLFARLVVADARLARSAAGVWINAPLMLRLASCAGLALAGHLLSGSPSPDRVNQLGRILRGAAGVALLGTLSSAWVLRQDIAIAAARQVHDLNAARHLEWRLQVGLSVLFTLYAAAALAWGFARRIPAVRYGALGLFGIVIVKVFLIDLAELQAIYRILSFFVLGLVLLGVSYVYQRRRPAGGSPAA